MFNTPKSFVIPSIYSSINPEEFAIVLMAGVSIIQRSREAGFMDRVNELKDKLKVAEANNHDILKQSIMDKIEEAVDNSMDGIVERLDDISSSALKRDKQEREEISRKITAKEAMIVKRTEDLSSYMDKISGLITRVENIDASRTSTIKGAKNERESHQLILEAFGNYGDFCMHEKKNYSGDHIFDWNGLRIMWEDKDYVRNVNKAEIDKAHRDLEANKDCHVLIFVSSNSSIVGHERGSGIDVEIQKGKLIIYISFFRNHTDPHGFIRMIIQPIINGLKSSLISNSFGTSRESESIRYVIDSLKPLIESVLEQERNCDNYLSDMKVRLQTMKNMIGRTRYGIEQVITSLLSAPTTVNNELDDTKKTGRKCGICGSTEHNRSRCPNNNDDTEIKCTLCSQVGHNSRSCPNKQRVIKNKRGARRIYL